jgi:hypothetical protein
VARTTNSFQVPQFIQSNPRSLPRNHGSTRNPEDDTNDTCGMLRDNTHSMLSGFALALSNADSFFLL